jgi:hypothetical protein
MLLEKKHTSIELIQLLKIEMYYQKNVSCAVP